MPRRSRLRCTCARTPARRPPRPPDGDPPGGPPRPRAAAPSRPAPRGGSRPLPGPSPVPRARNLMCIGVGASDGGQRRERPLDGDQVGDDLQCLGVRFEGIGPAGDLVQVRPDPRQLAGALSLQPQCAPRSRCAPGPPTGAPDPTASTLRSGPWRATRHAPPRWRGSSPTRRVQRSSCAVAVGGVRGGTAPRQLLPGTREAWPQRVGWLSLRKVHQAAPADALEAAPGAPLEAAAEDSQRSPPRYAAQSSISRRRRSNRSVGR